MVKLSDEDKAIIEQLKANSRISFVGLARATGVDRRACERRINKMLESGTITKFTIEVCGRDPSSFHIQFMLIETHSARVETMNEIEFCLGYHECVKWAGKIAGRWDYIIRIEHNDYDLVDRLIYDLSSIRGVKNTITLPVMRVIEDRVYTAPV